MRWTIVELDTGEQEFFETSYEGFRFAKRHEEARTHSVEYVAIGEFQSTTDHIVLRGQELRYMLRSLDNVVGWVKTERERESDPL